MEVEELQDERFVVTCVEAAVNGGLSSQVATSILNGTGQLLLDAIASASFEFSDIFLPLIHEVAADTLQRWLRRTLKDADLFVDGIDAFSRVLPFHPSLLRVVCDFLAQSRLNISSFLSRNKIDYETTRLLIGIFRLLSHDVQAIRDLVDPTVLITLFTHGSRHIRYLAIQCFALHVGIADHAVQGLVTKWVGIEPMQGQWDGRQDIDYRLFKLYEERRWQKLRNRLSSEAARSACKSFLKRFDHGGDLAAGVTSIAGVIVLTNENTRPSTSSFVLFDTARENLQKAAFSLKQSKACLLYGPAGVGKTSIVRELGTQVGHLANVVTLHLNEQTDAKSLLGIYTTSRSGAGFSWQPGVITRAVKEGKWIMIEDIDRAPAEVMGILRPLLEHNELYLPSRKERIRPHEKFRLFATVRTAGEGANLNSRNSLISNRRFWYSVSLTPYSSGELRVMLEHTFPELVTFLPAILQAHWRLRQLYTEGPLFRGLQSRAPSIRHLIKWCRRIAKRFNAARAIDPVQVPDTLLLEMLRDSLDCYAAHIAENDILLSLAQAVAESLNIAPSAAEYAVKHHNPIIQHHSSTLQVGRSSIPKLASAKTHKAQQASFAFTRCVRQNMETIVSAVAAKEPLLLVGETGVGKTTLIQHIARSIGQNLTVVNLSNQSEASDLLGGLKPVSMRTLTVPLVDEFNDLFDKTFSSNKNAKFSDSIAKAFAKQKWSTLFRHWEEAVQLALKRLPISPVEVENQSTPGFSREAQSGTGQAQDDIARASKRRKVDPDKYEVLRQRWSAFAQSVLQAKAHVQQGRRNQVFAFVESRLVQAVRSGGWLLLDEINLASSDTLDNIVSLLHSDGDGDTPYLLLAEAGNVERIDAHPDFRVFAAMNPATDTGKKDLPPAVRSYFTETYVHAPDRDVNDLVEVVQVYLGAILEQDQRAASDLAKAYLALKRLSEQHQLTDGAGDIPHFSLRSLTRTLSYVKQHSGSHGLRRALYEGLEMAFCTVLSSTSLQLATTTIEQHLATSQQAKRAIQSQKVKVFALGSSHVAFEHYRISRGPNSTAIQSDYIITKSVRRNLTNLARAASMHKFAILLQGPTSAGKTSMVEYLSNYTGNKFVRINNHEHTDLQEYLGSYGANEEGRLEFREGVLVEALRNGHWLVLDELNLAPSDVLEALNRLLDDNRELLIPETQEIVRPHPNFMLFATQNPAGLYGGRKRLSRAFRNRFLEIHVTDIPEDELEIILEERTHIAKSFCKNIVDVYKSLTLQRQSSRLFEAKNSFATLRDLFRWASRPVGTREELARHGYMLLAERVRNMNEKQIVKSTIEDVLRVKVDEQELYSNVELPHIGPNTTNITWTRAMRRLFVLVSTALKNNEPVLLVGETGCGKTQVCQCIAEAFNRQLHIYNAHSNTETGDLIGSQRPARHKSELAASIMQDLQNLGEDYSAMRTDASIGIDELIKQFRLMDTSILDQQAVQKVKHSIAAYQSLFAWSDGALVRAMKEGHHFLLDEISLADDSVLERMNSVLEPARTILLAEKGADDNFVVAKEGFQFLATMNPGGDYGKRELSAALRNRLTEIWVPPLSDEADVVPILQARLASADQTCKVDVQAMVKFALFFREEIQHSHNVNMPLRLLLGWADYIRQSKLHVAKSIVHGAALTFIDSIGADPAGSTTIANPADIAQARSSCLTKLGQLFNLEASTIYWSLPRLHLSPDEISIGDITLPRLCDSVVQQQLVFEAPTTLRNAMRIVRALQTDRPLLLEGNPGVGKTALVTSLAQLSGRPLTRINLSDQTDLMDLFGADAPVEGTEVGHFVWRDGPLLKAMQSGEWVLLDEMNLASQSVLEGLNACLDHRKEVYIAELDRTFPCHPDFTLFATQNPHSQGGGRKGLPASFVNRFTVVYADPFTTDDLLCICRSTYPNVSEDWITKMVNVITETQSLASRDPDFSEGGPWELNLRDISRWVALCKHKSSVNPSIHLRAIVASRFRTPGAVRKLGDICQRVFEWDMDQNLYHDLTSDKVQFGTAFTARNTSRQFQTMEHQLTVSQLSAAESLLTAWQMNWSLVLAGPSGSGKTSLIRAMAALRGDRLVEFSMNADIDTADLVGGYEQYDQDRAKTKLQDDLNQFSTTIYLKMLRSGNIAEAQSTIVACQHLVESKLSSSSILELISKTLPECIDAERNQLAKLYSKFQALEDDPKVASARFEWKDGILIDALETGAWLVLDNANLCSASVLDRLNSLLEPDGCLILSEQHSADGRTRVVRPAPGFRIILTMDPKHGELSRAMRNRSLEIFLSTIIEENDDTLVPAYYTDSSLTRLRRLVDVDRDTHEENPLRLEPLFEHLHPQECAMLQNGGNLIKDGQSSFGSSMERSLYSIDNKEEEPQFMWPCLPAINEPALLLYGLHGSSDIVHITKLQLLRNAYDNAKSVGQPLVAKHSDRRSKTIHPLLAIVRGLQLIIHDILSKEVKGARTLIDAGSDGTEMLHDQAQPIAALQEFISLYVDTIDLVLANEFQFVHAYRQIMADLTLNASLSMPDEWGKMLSQLAMSTGKLTSGQSLQIMWLTWKSSTFASQEQFTMRLAARQLLSQFDQAAAKTSGNIAYLAQLRCRLLALCNTDASEQWQHALLNELHDLINGLVEHSPSTHSAGGHFAFVFSTILQKLCLRDFAIDSKLEQTYLLLSDRARSSDSDLATASQSVRLLNRLSAIHNLERDAQTNILPFSLDLPRLVSAISTVQDQSIGQLEYAQEELQHVAKLVASTSKEIISSDLEHVASSTIEIAQHVLVAHQDLLPPSLDLEQLDTISQLASIADVATQSSNLEVTSIAPIFKDLLSACQELSHLSMAKEHDKHTICGYGLFIVAISCLKLFVPDELLDPAVLPLLHQSRHKKRKGELASRIATWQKFQQAMTGQDTSFVIRLLEEDLSALKQPPSFDAVWRPDDPRFVNELQVEFQNLLRTIVQSQLAVNLRSLQGQQLTSACNTLVSNIIGCYRRLGGVHRAYSDLVLPVQALLSALALGVSLIKLGASAKTSHANKPGGSSGRDLAKASLASPLATPNDGSLLAKHLVHELTLAERLEYLKYLRLRLAANDSSPQSTQIARSEQLASKYRHAVLAHIVNVVDVTYALWKEKLSNDQNAAEREARYYSYKGEDDTKEPDEADVRGMFPVYDDNQEQIYDNGKHVLQEDSDTAVNTTSIDVRTTAVELSRYLRSLRCPSNVQQLLQDQICGQLHAQDGMYAGSRKSEIVSAKHIPALILRLDQSMKLLDGDQKTSTINVYIDADVQEVHKMTTLIAKTRRRFQNIAERWPEHAVPAEVITYCDQSALLKISDPLAKLLSRAEKLLDLVSQWQAVASKEWTVLPLVESLTELIICWRRLELGSWSRLLDLEDSKQQDDADAWYFIAYETVVHNSIRYSFESQQRDVAKELHVYRAQLAKTLEDFLRTTTLGQFASRLELLATLADLLDAYAQNVLAQGSIATMHTHSHTDQHSLNQNSDTTDDPSLFTESVSQNDTHEHENDVQQRVQELFKVRDTVQNVVRHYQRYRPHIETLLHNGRLSLQKNISEQVKLASWKDTNVTALKESARRTHFKLFRVVKKYRALLNQPISSFVADYDVHTAPMFKQLPIELVPIDSNAVARSVEYCSMNVLAWKQRPERLRQPASAIHTMQYAYMSSLGNDAALEKLQHWFQDIKDSATELRKATPNTATENNTSVVRDLKQRKRRLLADTMKELTQMGIRRNLGTNELQLQSSTTLILATVPQVSMSIDAHLGDLAEKAFSEFLDIMNQARDASLEHSIELTDGETRRGIGYLEGFLSLMIRQRTQLALYGQQVQYLKETAQNFGPVDHEDRLKSASTRTSRPLLPYLLRICADVIELQNKQAWRPLSISDLPDSLRKHATSLMDGTASDMQEVYLRVKNDIHQVSKDEPQVEWLLEYLRPCWDENVYTNGVYYTDVRPERFDDSIHNALNIIFVALQRLSEHSKTLSTNSEGHGWLSRTLETYDKLCSVTKLATITDVLNPAAKVLWQQHMPQDQEQLLTSLSIVAQPIIMQFQAIVEDVFVRYAQLHVQMCHTAIYLGKTFTTLCKEGFCTPPESADEQEQSGKVEQGTGLGEGDAAQDISKDVGEDEDLTELAQEKNEQDDGNQAMDKSNDAVDMGTEDLEGEMGSGDEQISGDEAESGDEDQNGVDEETGSVDDLDPNAVDEKMWEDMQKEAEQNEKELKSQKAQGQKKDDQVAGDEGQKQEDDADLEANETAGDDEKEEDGAQKAEAENMDPHLDQEQALELPEDVQLNGEQEVDEEISDADMNELSDIDNETKQDDRQQTDLPDEDKIDRDDDANMSDDINEEEFDDRDGTAQDNEVVEDPQEDGEDEDKDHDARQDDAFGEMEDQESGEVGLANTNRAEVDDQIDENAPEGGNDPDMATQTSKDPQNKQSAAQEQSGETGGAHEQGTGQQDDVQDKSTQALQKLADVLERYHQRTQIHAYDEQKNEQTDQDINMEDADFEHVDKAENERAQALGTADEDHAQNLDKSQAIADSRAKPEDDLQMSDDKDESTEAQEPESLTQKMTRLQDEQQDREQKQEPLTRNAILPDRSQERASRNLNVDLDTMDLDEDSDDQEKQLILGDTIQQAALPDTLSAAEAQHLWSLATNRTTSLSLALTEQLRLILAPTTATKLRGDFRTGKRLNIRRIIPYIASGYKRDKIWMRRSIPSKRNYQVMLAVDDSRSMKESGADVLALETLCLVSRSLSMLEVGELCVVAFGKDYRLDTAPGATPKAVKVAHEFGVPFSPSSSGPETFAHFSFEQTGTNIKALLSESIRIFRDARIKSTAREASELWQLQLILSDGHIGSDSESVARLVRKAREEKIMCVFVIVDDSKESIVDLKEVVFEKPPADAKGGKDVSAEPIMITKRYLEGFPFQYYVVVRDVMDLPGVLSRVLRGWFESVVEQG